MKILKQFRITILASMFTGLLMTAAAAKAGEIRGSSGNNFTLTPTANPGVFTLTHPGVAQVSLIGNCTFDGTETVVFPATPDQPLTTTGTFRFTSADGTTTLDVEAEGTGMPDPANPNFVNIHYNMKFIGGTGKMANARGQAKLHGVAMLTPHRWHDYFRVRWTDIHTWPRQSLRERAEGCWKPFTENCLE